MATRITKKGQVTIPKRVRDALGLTRGTAVAFAADKDGNVTLRKAVSTTRKPQRGNRFSAARGRADIKWRTDDLMDLLRGEG